jgi:dephospho-CoA kinase
MPRLNQDKLKFLLGVTGSIGSGKSTVAAMFGSCGASIIDADKIAHACLSKDSPAYRQIIARFGKIVLNNSSAIDRRKLGQIVFNDSGLLQELNRIIQPQVIRLIRAKINHTRDRVIVLDAPLLVEAGLAKEMDALIVVKCNKGKQLKRVIKKTGLTKTDILKRLRTQSPERLKKRLADFVIDNSNSLGETRKHVKEIWKKLEGNCGKT